MSRKRVCLVVTGDLEQQALGRSLRRVFAGVDVEFEAVQCYSTTDARHPPPWPRRELARIDDLASALAAEVTRKRPSFDLCLAIEDLELKNLDQPEIVVSSFARAVSWHLDRLAAVRSMGYRDRVGRALRERASFHLLVPMIEGYFFADPAALTRAGGQRPALWRPPHNTEAFEATDPDYLAAFTHCERNPRRPKPCPWNVQGRERHPKHYVQFLASPAHCASCTFYRESGGGVAALDTLDWTRVFPGEESAPFARSLIEDIALALDVACPFPGCTAPETRAFRPDLRSPVLRNAEAPPVGS